MVLDITPIGDKYYENLYTPAKPTDAYTVHTLGDLPGEKWKEVPYTDGHYQISSHGRVKSLDRFIEKKNGQACFFKGRILKQSVIKYKNNTVQDFICELVCTASFNGQHIRIRVHRMVYSLFVKEIDYKNDKMLISHIDNNHFNNHYNNLVATTHGEKAKRIYKNARGPRLYLFQTTEGKTKAAVSRKVQTTQFDAKGNPLRTFESIKLASAVTGINSSAIVAVCKQKRGMFTAGGYLWRYGKHQSPIDISEIIRHKEKLRKQLQQPVTQYTLQGEKVKTYASIKQAACAINRTSAELSSAIKGKVVTCGGFLWRKGVHRGNNHEITAEHKQAIHKSISNIKKPVLQICKLTKKVINKFDSISEASRYMGCSTSDISRAATIKNAICKGFYWRYIPVG
jgi:NUMOD4 motif/NUMOD1 domain